VDGFTFALQRETATPRAARAAIESRFGNRPRSRELVLCVSEVVTNALIHAHSRPVMAVGFAGDLVRVEVADQDSTLPVRRPYSTTATTGRGLHILDELAQEWGVERTPTGKVVWFTFDVGGRRIADGSVRVELLSLPVALHRLEAEHVEALRREIAFIEHAHEQPAVARVRALATMLGDRLEWLSATLAAHVDPALARGDITIDVELRLGRDAADSAARLGAVLEDLDALCTDGDLLTLVTPPEAARYRRWCLGEIVAQLRDHRVPRPWRSQPEAMFGVTAPQHDGHAARFAVSDELDLELASTLREELIECIDSGVTAMVLDLTDCGYVDSAGISLHISVQRRLASKGGSLALTGVADGVRRTLETAGVASLFEVER
jgi:anti-anti-sigma factor